MVRISSQDSRPLNPAFLRYFTPNAVTGRRVPLFGLKSVEGVPGGVFSVEMALLRRVQAFTGDGRHPPEILLTTSQPFVT